MVQWKYVAYPSSPHLILAPHPPHIFSPCDALCPPARGKIRMWYNARRKHGILAAAKCLWDKEKLLWKATDELKVCVVNLSKWTLILSWHSSRARRRRSMLARSVSRRWSRTPCSATSLKSMSRGSMSTHLWSCWRHHCSRMISARSASQRGAALSNNLSFPICLSIKWARTCRSTRRSKLRARRLITCDLCAASSSAAIVIGISS